MKQKLDAARLDFVRQIAAGLDHLDHAFGARRFFEELIDLIEGGFQITAGVLRMRIRISADCIDGQIDAIADQTRRHAIADRRFFADRGTIKLLVDVAMAFDDNAAHDQFFCIHKSANPFLEAAKVYCGSNTG